MSFPASHSLAFLRLLSPMYISWRRSTSPRFLKTGSWVIFADTTETAVYRIDSPARQQVEGLAVCRTVRLPHLHKVRTKLEQVPDEGNLNGS